MPTIASSSRCPRAPRPRASDVVYLKNIFLIGFSTGGGEVARYVGRHGTRRVAKIGLISAVPPLMLKTEKDPDGLPIEVFEGIRAGSVAVARISRS